MTEIERYEPARAAVDSWVEVLAPVGNLAAEIAQTAFVPDSLRGNTAAVAAAILTGREMDLGPMVSLRHIHVVKGRPGQSAELMRGLVLSKGHKIRYVDTTDTRCIVEGRRKDEQDWTRVTFTADQAKRAKIDLGGYPEDKLVARATARLCRRIFADVVVGMPYTTDELEDVDEGAAPSPAPAETAEKPKRRTAQRRTTAKAETPKDAPPVEEPKPSKPSAAPKAEVPPPPLPGEDGYDDPPAPAPKVEPVTPDQLKKIATVFGVIGWTDRGDKLRAASTIVGRPLGSSKDLTKGEASTLIDTLDMVAQGPDPAERLGELLATVRESEAHQDDQGDGDVVDAEVVEDPDADAAEQAAREAESA